MSTTKLVFRGYVRQDLRDADDTNYTFSNDEVDDLIGEGIEELSFFYPKEIVGSLTIVSGTDTYALPTGMSWPFRVLYYNSSGDYQEALPAARGSSPNTGWDFFADLLRVPPSINYTASNTFQVWGYGKWTYIDSDSATSATTDLDQTGLWAVREFCQYKAFARLVGDRAKFGQWIQNPENTDVTALSLQSMMKDHRDAWTEFKNERRKFARRS